MQKISAHIWAAWDDVSSSVGCYMRCQTIFDTFCVCSCHQKCAQNLCKQCIQRTATYMQGHKLLYTLIKFWRFIFILLRRLMKTTTTLRQSLLLAETTRNLSALFILGEPGREPSGKRRLPSKRRVDRLLKPPRSPGSFSPAFFMSGPSDIQNIS